MCKPAINNVLMFTAIAIRLTACPNSVRTRQEAKGSNVVASVYNFGTKLQNWAEK